MGESFELDAPDHFTAGTTGAPGERVFYVQARQQSRLVTLKSEKEQVRSLADYLAGLLVRKPGAAGAAPADLDLLEPADPAWAIASLAVGYDEARQRILVEATELLEEEGEGQGEERGAGEPAVARFHITRAQAAAFVAQARALIRAGRPLCPMCSQPMGPEGHVCPRSNGHVVR
ncbi:MAG: DUF3090 family protein [Candidatus Rokubacteria bacterium]|nr:DUF3090 family protein [Candidatus Rokubacteria bacterium]